MPGQPLFAREDTRKAAFKLTDEVRAALALSPQERSGMELDVLRGLVQHLECFQKLPAVPQHAFLAALRLQAASAEEIVGTQNPVRLCIVLSGAVALHESLEDFSCPDHPLGTCVCSEAVFFVDTLECGACFGEAALGSSPSRDVGLCLEAAEFLVVHRDEFHALGGEASGEHDRHQREEERYLFALRMVGEHDAQPLAQALVPLKASANQVVAKQGELSEKVFFVRSGSLLVIRKTRQGDLVRIDNLVPRDHYGAHEVLEQEPYFASLVADPICEMYVLSAKHLLKMKKELVAALLSDAYLPEAALQGKVNQHRRWQKYRTDLTISTMQKHVAEFRGPQETRPNIRPKDMLLNTGLALARPARRPCPRPLVVEEDLQVVETGVVCEVDKKELRELDALVQGTLREETQWLESKDFLIEVLHAHTNHREKTRPFDVGLKLNQRRNPQRPKEPPKELAVVPEEALAPRASKLAPRASVQRASVQRASLAKGKLAPPAAGGPRASKSSPKSSRMSLAPPQEGQEQLTSTELKQKESKRFVTRSSAIVEADAVHAAERRHRELKDLVGRAPVETQTPQGKRQAFAGQVGRRR